MASNKIEILVLGGGGFGAELTYRLAPLLDASKHNLTMISPRPFVQHLMAAARTYWPGGLNLPVGPDSREESRKFLKEWRKRVADAKRICIIGGGAVGIETAGEIRHYHPKTKITLIHDLTLLTNNHYPDKMRRALGQRLKEINVDVILDDQIDIPEELVGERTVTTREGAQITADLWIPCPGPKSNTSYLPRNLLNSEGRIPIQPTMQVPGHPNVFACGDIIQWTTGEARQLAKAKAQLDVVLPNLLSLVNGENKPLKIYKGGLDGLFVSFGKDRGVGYVPIWWGIIVGNYLAVMAKSKDLFLTPYRKNIGAPAIAIPPQAP